MRVNTKRMRDKIVELCKKDPTLADDDKRLIATVWYTEGWKDPDLLKHLRAVSSSDTIRRTRAKLREEGIIKPSEAVDEKRYNEMGKAREELGY